MNSLLKNKERSYGLMGYDDPKFVDIRSSRWTVLKMLSLLFALSFLVMLWFALDQKLIFGGSWISDTYDNPDWKTNEGDLHTFGAWDIETHIWKTEYIYKNFPNYQWNPYWYLGMPLLKYYQSGFYFLNIAFMMLLGLDAARTALLMIVYGHLLATFMTFIVCYKVSRRIWASALSSSFLIANTFISLRSYGWEPITVVFLFLYPLGLYLFLKEPLKPFRFWLILVLGITYISHPLIWFALCMFMGIYLFSIAVRHDVDREAQTTHYLGQYVGIVALSLLLGAVQFLPQLTYEQVTSGVHMGVQYLPYYQVPTNVISLVDFFFDAGNLKGPGPIIMIAFFLLLIFGYLHYLGRDRNKYRNRKLHNHVIITGLTLVLAVMVLFYYLELFNVFPMNILRGIQYHRIIPEFLITASILVAAMSNITYTYRQKVMYYSMLIAFVAASGIIIYNVQTYWQTSSEIQSRPEFIHEPVEGRITMPYIVQSFAVRNSFTLKPQLYGYYEQGITNPYADEMFSVSSGFHNANLTTIYLKAANIGRLYISKEEGDRSQVVMVRLNGTLPYYPTENPRYGYFRIDLKDPSYVEAVDQSEAEAVQELEPRCRVMFRERYCGSVREEFVSTDYDEASYLTSYVNMLEAPYRYDTKVKMEMTDPDHYVITVADAEESTAFVVKMTYDTGFTAKVDGKKVPVTRIGPSFMLISPGKQGSYEIKLDYSIGTVYFTGLFISILTFLGLSSYFLVQLGLRVFRKEQSHALPYMSVPKGDMK
jgi:hypothetical protein